MVQIKGKKEKKKGAMNGDVKIFSITITLDLTDFHDFFSR